MWAQGHAARLHLRSAAVNEYFVSTA
jgi:hypothetical protein